MYSSFSQYLLYNNLKTNEKQNMSWYKLDQVVASQIDDFCYVGV